MENNPVSRVLQEMRLCSHFVTIYRFNFRFSRNFNRKIMYVFLYIQRHIRKNKICVFLCYLRPKLTRITFTDNMLNAFSRHHTSAYVGKLNHLQNYRTHSHSSKSDAMLRHKCLIFLHISLSIPALFLM
jgi:hypothetical protein